MVKWKALVLLFVFFFSYFFPCTSKEYHVCSDRVPIVAGKLVTKKMIKFEWQKMYVKKICIVGSDFNKNVASMSYYTWMIKNKKNIIVTYI
jgi:hypothetical protein